MSSTAEKPVHAQVCPSESALSVEEDPGPDLIHDSLGRLESTSQTEFRLVYPFCMVHKINVSNTDAHRPRNTCNNNSPHSPVLHAMRPNN